MLGDDSTLHGMHTNGNDWLHVDKGGAQYGTTEAQAQLSYSRAVAWALCLEIGFWYSSHDTHALRSCTAKADVHRNGILWSQGVGTGTR